MVRLPLNVTNILSRIRTAANAFEQENQRPPSSAELAERTGMSVEKVEEYLGHTTSTISMDTPLSADSDATVGEMLPDLSSSAADETLIAESLRHDLQIAMSSCSRREQEIIRMYYGLDGEARSMDEIAMDYHLSRERVRQLIDGSIATIRSRHGEALRKYA
jgi:RNA polymerase primary sigma factor